MNGSGTCEMPPSRFCLVWHCKTITAYLAGIFATVSISGTDENIGNRLQVRPVAVVVAPHGQLNFPQYGALSTACYCGTRKIQKSIIWNAQELRTRTHRNEWFPIRQSSALDRQKSLASANKTASKSAGCNP